MKIEIVDGVLVIEIPVNKPFTESGTGKSLMVASSNGIVQTDYMVEGKPLFVGLNAYIKNDAYVKPAKAAKPQKVKA